MTLFQSPTDAKEILRKRNSLVWSQQSPGLKKMYFEVQLVAKLWKGPELNPMCAWEGRDDLAHSKGISNTILSLPE